MTDNLTGYDIVAGVTENTINGQLMGLLKWTPVFGPLAKVDLLVI